MRTRRRWNWLKRSLLSLFTLALVTACQHPFSQDSPVRQNAGNLPEQTTSCRVVTHELGTTEVCGQPQRIAVLSPHILDIILALGAQPAAYAESASLNLETFDQPKAQILFLGERVTTQPVNLGDRKNPSLEKLALTQPDLILGEDWLNGRQYPLLKQIAPTVLITDKKGDEHHWIHSIKPIAQALGQEQDVQPLIAAYEQQLATARSQLKPVVNAYPKVLILSADTTLRDMAIAADSTAGVLLEKIGFHLVLPESAASNGTRWMQPSVEVLPTLDADITIVIGWSASNLYHPENQLKAKWNQNPVLSAISAAKADRLFFVDYHLWGSITRGPITDQLILQELSKMLLPLVSNS